MTYAFDITTVSKTHLVRVQNKEDAEKMQELLKVLVDEGVAGTVTNWGAPLLINGKHIVSVYGPYEAEL